MPSPGLLDFVGITQGQTLSYPHEFDKKSDLNQWVTKYVS